MQIVVTFDTFEEFETFRSGSAAAPAPKPAKAVKAAKPAEETAQAKKEQKEEAKSAPAPEGKPSVADPIDETYRTSVRKVLGQLNKKTGSNTARDLIREFGVDKLTDVKLEDLPKLMAKAEEALDA